MLRIILVALLLLGTCVAQVGIPFPGPGMSAASGGPSFKGGWAWSTVDLGAACASPCTVTLTQTAAVGDTVVIVAVNSFGNFGCTDNGSGGANTYSVDQNGGNSIAFCKSAVISHQATTITVTETAFGGNLLVAARVITGATAQDGADKWTTIGGLSFTSSSLTPSANGIAVGFMSATASNPKPITVATPWADSAGVHGGGTPETRANASGWVLAVSDIVMASGSAFTLSGSSTANNLQNAGLAGFK